MYVRLPNVLGVILTALAAWTVTAPAQSQTALRGEEQAVNRQSAAADDWAPGVLPRASLPKGRALDYDFNDVQMSTILGWLRRVRVEPPVALSGQVSGWVWAQAPSQGWWRLGNYRVEGEITSPLLDIDRFALRTARVRFGYRDRLWTVGRVAGQMESRADIGPASDSASTEGKANGEVGGQRRVLGQAEVAGTLPMSANGPVSISGNVQRVALDQLMATLGLRSNVPTGMADGTFELKTTIAQLSQPLTWQAHGKILTSPLKLGGFPETTLNTDWKLGNAQLTLSNIQAAVLDQTLRLAASIQLKEDFAWQVEIPPQSVALAENLYRSLGFTASTALPIGQLQIAGASKGQFLPWGAEYALQVASTQLTWFDNVLVNLEAALALTPAGIRLDRMSAKTAGGQVVGSGLWPVNAATPIEVRLNYQDINLARVRTPGNTLPSMVGIVSGSGIATLDSAGPADLKRTSFDVQGSGRQVRIDQWGLGDITYRIQNALGSEEIDVEFVDRPQAAVAAIARAATPALASSPRWGADGKFQPNADGSVWEYKLDIRGNQLDLSFAQLAALLNWDEAPRDLIQTVFVTGDLSVRGNDREGMKTSAFNFAKLTARGSNDEVWATGSLVGSSTTTEVDIENGDFQIGGGNVHLETKWSFDGEEADHLRLQVDQFSLDTVRSWGVIAMPTPIKGTLRADIDVQRPADVRPAADDAYTRSPLAGWQGMLDITMTSVALREQVVGDLHAHGQLSANTWNTTIDGIVFNAPLDGKLDVLIAQDPSWSVSGVQGQLTWTGASADRLMGMWQSREQAAQWRGQVNVRSEIDWHIGGQQSGLAQLDIPLLAYQGRGIARDVMLEAALQDDEVRIVRFGGSIAGGRMDADGSYNFTTQQASELAVQLQRVSLAELVKFLDPAMAIDTQGRADLRARIVLRDGMAIHGSMRLHDALLYHLPLSDAHGDFELITSPDYSSARVRAANIRGRAFGGRLNADVNASVGTRISFESRARIERGEVEQLSKWSRTAAVVGQGKFDATLTLGATQFTSPRDMRGRLELNFDHTDARTLPIAGQLSRFVPLFGLSSTEFERGTLVGTISQGDLRMRTLTLWGPQLSVLGSGNIGLTSGRLDLQLVIRSGGGLGQQIAASYLAQIAATSAPPVELVLQVNRLISNRAIFLRVAGTAAKPVIQPQAGRIVEQALLRSLLEQAAPFGSVAAGAALGQ